MKTTPRFSPAKALLLTLAVISANSVLAQDTAEQEQDIEEVVVTGSYIRNSQFTNASPIQTITQDEIWESGASNIGEYLRDLPYMENIDVVANTLDAGDGQQDSNSARFNLRGLGTESTLTLVDGRRAVNEGAVAGLLPSIAQQRVEIVVDGGAAIYGADAVAGIANMIPYKEYDGFKVRTYYKRDQPGDTEQNTIEILTGRSFDIGVNWVGALEYRTRTALNTSERPKYLEVANQDTTTFNPGVWQNYSTSALPSGRVRDPSCGTFNEGHTDLGGVNSFPSGVPGGTATVPNCVSQYGEWQDFARPSLNYTLFNNFTYSPTDWLNLEFQMSHNYRESQLIFSPSSAVTTRANQQQLRVNTNHPANPFGKNVMPSAWRPFAKGGTMPSSLVGSGHIRQDYPYYSDSYKFGGDFRISDTSWQGEAWMGYQTYRRTVKNEYISLSRMSAALLGQGGPNGNEWYNPFGSADPRSPSYVNGIVGQGGTANSQELIDWLLVENTWRTDENRLKYLDVVFNGDVFEIPAGMIKGAVGFQFRHARDWNYNDPSVVARDDISVSVNTFIPTTVVRDSGVRSVFMELEVPLITDSALGSVGLKAAVRNENFYTLGFESTKPKFSVLWELNDSFAMRASYAESFLAPSPGSLRPAILENCVDIANNTIDPLTGDNMGGLPSCSSGNPDLRAEESELYNIGFTWQPIEGLSINLDYQEIEYFDRLSTLASAQVTALQFDQFIGQSSIPRDQFSTANAAHKAEAVAWLLANPFSLVNRNATTGSVESVIRAPYNFSSQFVEGVDLRASYAFDYADWGRFTVSLSGNYYTRWEYQTSPTSPVIDARGFSNSRTAFAPPLAVWKGNMNLNWFRGNHSAGIVTRYIDNMIFDETALTTGFTVGQIEEIRPITKVDARYSHRFNLWDVDANVTVGVTNLFDREAQRLPVQNGLETRIDDPFGRQFYLSMDFEF